jgi:hypothetical protein
MAGMIIKNNGAGEKYGSDETHNRINDCTNRKDAYRQFHNGSPLQSARATRTSGRTLSGSTSKFNYRIYSIKNYRFG